MKRIGKTVLCFLFAAALLVPSLFLPRARAVEDPVVNSRQAICCQIESGKILYAKGEKDKIAPASFVKLMTALLAFEYRKTAGNVTVSVTEEMLAGAAGGMDLKAGEELPLDSLLAGLVMAGANDAAQVLASVVGGNIPSFVEDMNARAEELGMADTRFANPTGLDSPVMSSTLSDLLLLCRAVYRVNDFMVLSSVKSQKIPATNLSPERTVNNRNRMLFWHSIYPYHIPDSRGMVVGATENAGWCAATTRQKDECTTLVLVSGGTDLSEKQDATGISAFLDAKTLIEWAETNFARFTLVSDGEVFREVPVSLAADVDHLILVADGSLQVTLEKDFDPSSRALYKKIVLDGGAIQAPVVKGQVFGRVELYLNEEFLGSVPLAAQSAVARSQASSLWNAVKRFFSSGPAFVILLLVGLVAAAYLAILIFTVIRQNLVANRERRLAARRLEEEEDRRLEAVRKKERARRGVRMRNAGTFFREGFRVMTGSASGQSPSRGVARVPEKYRRYPGGTAPRSAPGREPRREESRQAQDRQLQPQRQPQQQVRQAQRRPQRAQQSRQAQPQRQPQQQTRQPQPQRPTQPQRPQQQLRQGHRPPQSRPQPRQNRQQWPDE